MFKYIKSNWWRFTPDTWIDWFYYHRSNLRSRYDTWRYWYSPPWSNKRRCVFCGGSGVGSRGYNNTHACDDCGGSGMLPKLTIYHYFYEKWIDFRKKI